MKTTKKIVSKVKTLITKIISPIDMSLADRESYFLADLVKLNIKYGIGLSISVIDLKHRDSVSIN